MAKLKITVEPGINGKSFYFPGEIIKGTVEIKLERNQKFRALFIQVIGKAKAEVFKFLNASTANYGGKEVYINSKTYLFGKENGESLEIQKGTYDYNFNIQLPNQIPYSFTIDRGEIYYKIKAVLDIPWGLDEIVELPLTVLSNYDLNLYPQLKMPYKIEKCETFFSFKESKPLKIQVMLPYTGYTVGQHILVTIKYENESNVDVLRTQIKLKQEVSMHSNDPKSIGMKLAKNDIVIVMVGGAKAGTSNDVKAVLQIPPVMGSNDKFCKIIVVTYFLKINVQLSGLYEIPKIFIPIAIGNVPLRFENQQTAPSAPSLEINEASAPPSYDDLPPSFEEVMKMSNVENVEA